MSQPSSPPTSLVRRRLSSPSGGLPAALTANALFLVTGAVNLPAPLYAAYADSAGMGIGAATLAFACYVAGLVPVLLFLGGLSDRIGRKPPLLIALAIAAGATALLVVHPGLLSLGVARLL